MKTLNASTMTKALAAVSFAVLVSCGANPLKTYEKKDPAEDATVALEEGNPDKAISILTSALEGDPNNYQYVSILALAYAERGGLDALTLAQKMASNNSSGSSGGVTSLFSVMPAATDGNIADVDRAATLMVTIPSANRTTADVLKIAIFQTAALTLRSKKYDTNGDGVISAAEALAMTAGDSAAILAQLSGAAAAFASSGSTSSTDQAAAAQITSIQTKIATCPGADSNAQLQNYLSKTGC